MILWPPSGPGGGSNFISIAAGYYYNLGLTSDGNVVYWDQAAHIVTGMSNVVAIAPNNYNDYGVPANLALLGDGTLIGNARLAGLSNVVALAQGAAHSLALRLDGSVVGWGDNSYGQASVPSGLSNVTAIAAGYFHSLALKSDGIVVAWGRNIEGQTNVPLWLSNVVAIAAGGLHSLALRGDGSVVAWGSNIYGQTNVPVDLTNVLAIAAGQFHSIALLGQTSPVTQASMSNPKIGPNGFSTFLPSQSGKVYSLEYKLSLEDAGWLGLPLVPGTGRMLMLIDPNATNSQGFYRVQRW
jgi:alpha-tubulin suppressor-like RCC1 family protein